MKNSVCPNCGNNPVPHFLNWYFESSNIAYAPLRRFLVYNPLVNTLKFFFQYVNFGIFVAKIFLLLGVLKQSFDKNFCKVRRAQVLWEDGEKRGIKMSELFVFKRPFDVYLAKGKGKTILFNGLPRPKQFNSQNLDVLDDKVILKKKFLAAGLPVPMGGSCFSFAQARKFFRSVSKPVIVKPRAGSRGRHTTTFVSSEADLKKAYKIAKQLCFFVVVEEQLMGPVYRATVIDYKVRGVLRGDSPFVVGDGKKTIEQLVRQKNFLPHPGVKDILLTPQTQIFLERQLTFKYQTQPNYEQEVNIKNPFNYAPQPGESISLSEKIGVSYGGSSSEDTEICHPDNLELFAKAARVAGDPIVGFDYITADITKSYKQQKTGFIEANSLPFINLHHDPLQGKPINIAKYVWDLVGM